MYTYIHMYMENDHSKRREQFNCGAIIRQNGVEPHRLLCVKAGIMIGVPNKKELKSRIGMNGMSSGSTAPCWQKIKIKGKKMLGSARPPHASEFQQVSFFTPL